MKNIIILYHTGVGSTKILSLKIKEKLEELLCNISIDIENIEKYKNYLKIKTYDLVIFGFPLRNNEPSKTFVNALGRLSVSLDKIPCALFTTCDFLPGNSLRDVATKLKTKNYYCCESTYFKTPSPEITLTAPYIPFFKKYEGQLDKKLNRFVRNLCDQLNKNTFIYHNPPFRYESIIQKPFNFFKRSKKVYINYDICDKCGECINLCPQNCYSLEDNGYPNRDPKKCENCLRCIHYCPNKCISLYKNKRTSIQLKDDVLEELLEIR